MSTSSGKRCKVMISEVCPVDDCSWNGILEDLKVHVQTVHPHFAEAHGFEDEPAAPRAVAVDNPDFATNNDGNVDCFVFAIEKMGCKSCVGKIQEALSACTGVLEVVHVSLESKQAKLWAASSAFDPKGAAEVVADLGFPCSLVHEEGDGGRKRALNV